MTMAANAVNRTACIALDVMRIRLTGLRRGRIVSMTFPE